MSGRSHRHVEFVKLEQWVVHKGLNAAARLSAALSADVPDGLHNQAGTIGVMVRINGESG